MIGPVRILDMGTDSCHTEPMSATTQQFQVTTADGATFVACCGPRVLATADVVAYRQVGDARMGACCHAAPTMHAEVMRAEREAYEVVAVHEALAAMAGDRR